MKSGRGSRENDEKRTEINRLATASEMRSELAGPQFGGVRQPWFPPVATGLTPSSLGMVLESANQGDIEQILLLAAEMEEREPHYASVLQTRKLAVRSMTFSVEPTGTLKREVRLAEEVQHIINSPSFRQCMHDLLDAIGKGFSVVEIVWDTRSKPWKPLKFVWQPPHYFRFDARIGRELLLRSEENPNGVELPENKFLIHRSSSRSGPLFRGGVARTVAALYLGKGYAMRDWITFCDVYGIPLRIGKHAPNASADERRALLSAIRALGSSAAAVMPASMQIETQAGVGGTHGAQVFGEYIDMINREVSKLVLGQTMTTESGSSLSQAQVHDRVRNDILWADTQALVDTINEQFIKTYVRLNYGDTIEPPILKATQDEREDLAVLANALIPFIDRGLTVSMGEIADRFGLSKPEDVIDAFNVQPMPTVEPVLNATQRKDSIDKLAEEAASEWEPVMSPLVVPILNAAENARDYDDFRKNLKVTMQHVDTTAIVESLAYNTFVARADASVEAQKKVDKNE